MKLSYKKRNTMRGYAFISIWLIGFLVFTLYPIIYSAIISFHKVVITTNAIEMTFTGMQNFRDALFVDVQYTQYLAEFLKELVFTVPLVIVFSIVIALLLNLKIKGKGIFRVIFFLPVIVMSGPVMMQLMEQKAFEIVDIMEYPLVLLVQENFEGIIWDLFSMLLNNMIYVFWQTGVQVLFFLAALQKIDKQVYEASRIDGASPWESFWKITLPTLKPIILINIIYTIVTLSTFEFNNVVTHISDQMFSVSGGYGMAAAMTWIYFLIIAIVLLLVSLLFMEHRKKGGTA